VIDAHLEVVYIRFLKIEGDLSDIRPEVQEIKRVIFKPTV
jgi:hypothetical protein